MEKFNTKLELKSTTGYEQSNDPLQIPSLIMKKINDSIQEGFVISSELRKEPCSSLESDLASGLYTCDIRLHSMRN